MKKLSIIATILLAFGGASTVSADMVGGELFIGAWQHDPSGWVQYKGDRVDVENDLHMKSKTEVYARAKFEHPIPIVPNIMVSYTKMRSNGSGKISKDFKFGGETFTKTENAISDAKLDQIDTTLYYKVLDNALKLDIGLSVKYINGYIDIKTATEHEHKSLSIPLPMLYVGTEVWLPYDFSVAASAKAIAYSGSQAYDVMAALRYDIAAGLGIEAGYRMQRYKLDDVDDTSSDLKFKGFYAGADWRF